MAAMETEAKRKAVLAEDMPWRALPTGQKPYPKIHLNPVLRVSRNPTADYAILVMTKKDPIGDGFAMDARLEDAGADFLVPGQVAPVRILGMKIWPIEINLKFLEPVGRQLNMIGKFLDSAITLMNASSSQGRYN
ncbi:hypothetical protein ZOSMA_159G00450 [Zostera marina]|uniref:Uncharacterized protein n=1 Tax=Zostera marina TaxID=29655 RepID=A0A0K9PV49_ZOSMR|nr:hypothetical protein ZOSMA_159G00450 [Zostera marina]